MEETISYTKESMHARLSRFGVWAGTRRWGMFIPNPVV